jgi:hypothetical protein
MKVGEKGEKTVGHKTSSAENGIFEGQKNRVGGLEKTKKFVLARQDQNLSRETVQILNKLENKK